MLNTRNPVQSGTYCCTLPAAIYLTDYYVTCIQRQRIFFKTPCDSGGTRTLDPSIKSAVLYLLSYEVILSKNYLFVLTSAKLRIISQTAKYFTNFFIFFLWARQDLNLHSSDYESATLTIKLRALTSKNYFVLS